MARSASQAIAAALVDIQAVGFKPETPLTFKSGMVSPVYIDNRRFPYFPEQWKTVIEGFVNLIQKEKLKFEVIAGIESAGIPHSAALGYRLDKPSVFVRKKLKDHGTKIRVEGGEVAGKQVLLIEDHVTTGLSSLTGVEALRESGAQVDHCLSITDYGFAEADKAFGKAKVKLHTLVSFPEVLEVSLEKRRAMITDWMDDPWGWAKRHGYEHGV